MTITELYNKYSDYVIVFIVLVLYFILNLYLKRRIKKIKRSIYEKYNIVEKEQKNISEIQHISEEDQLNYYRNKNLVSLIRFGVLFFLVSFYILNKSPNFFSFFAIATGAIIITFKELIQNFIGFFYISTQYKIGDDIIINDGKTELRGEIIYINIMNIGVVGKDENWEDNGQLYRIPNYKFFSDIIKREDISLHKCKKEDIVIFYRKNDFNVGFDDFVKKIEEYLEKCLPKRTISNAGNFKTFIGYKYKIRLEYEKEFLLVKINFVIKPRNVSEIEKGLFSLVENLKK